MGIGTLVSSKRVTTMVTVLLAVAAVARAQSTGCTYERCALRIEADPNVPLASRLVQGVEAKPVATLGLLVPRIPMLESSPDTIRRPYLAFRSRAKASRAIGVVGAGVTIASAIAFASTEPTARERYVVPAVTLDVALGVGALIEGVRAHNALAAAIERYNSALPSGR
jgi:hypothetical protein